MASRWRRIAGAAAAVSGIEQLVALHANDCGDEVNNRMVDTGGDYPRLGGAPTPPDLTVSLACDGAGIGSLTVGRGSTQDISINFISGR